MTIEILVVEDNDDMYEGYSDAAHELGEHLKLTRQTSASDAKKALLSKDFDGAIVDLNLDSSNPGEASGNSVLEEIIGRHRFPVLVVSGNIQNLAESIRDRKSAFLRFFDRTDSNDEILKCLQNIHGTGITRILGGRGQMEHRLGQIFWRHLAGDFEKWAADGVGSERMLLRYTVAHLAEYLDVPDGEDVFYHEAEFYIRPPIREHIATGDIVEKAGIRYVVLSPACDVAVRGEDENGKPIINATNIVLAPLMPVDREAFLAHGIIGVDSKSEEREKALSEIIKGQREKYVFLPGGTDMSPSVVDLQNIHSWSFESYLNQDVVRVATISGIFLKDVQSRFSAYYGRQGQPDLDKKRLLKEYKKRLTPPTQAS